MTVATDIPIVDLEQVRDEIRAMYREVARDPMGDFHFEMGRPLAERLGYPARWLDAVPPEALASFAGVGHMIDLAELAPGDRVVDLGSGSGTDAFVAAHLVGPDGGVIGVDMTEHQLGKARTQRDLARIDHAVFVKGYVEEPPVEAESAEAVISNGVLNLVPDKAQAFASAARVLRPGGRLALADIVSARELKPQTRANTQLWAACIAGAVPLDRYLDAIRAAGLTVEEVRLNHHYRFVSQRAQDAADRYGVVSVSIRATKDAGRA
jgi:SAM-dependent methyltransferase